MLKVLDVIPLPNTEDNIRFSIMRNTSSYIGEDSFYYNDFSSSINTEDTRRIIIVAIFEKQNVRLLLEIYSLISKNMEIFPILVKYRDIRDQHTPNNDLVILSNINNLYKFGLISYNEGNNNSYNLHNHPYRNDNLNVDTFYNRIMPKFFWEINEYIKEPSYKCFTKLLIPDYSYSLVNKLENAVHYNELISRNKVINSRPKLFNNFEYILFNVDNNWSANMIKELKYLFIDTTLMSNLVKNHRRTPMMISSPKFLLDENRCSNHYVTYSSIELYRELLFGISDFHVVFHDVTLVSKLEIKYAYSSLMPNIVSENETKSSIARLKNNVLRFLGEYDFQKSKTPIDVEIIKNFYGEVIMNVVVQNERAYSFHMDLFMFPLAAEGIDVNF